MVAQSQRPGPRLGRTPNSMGYKREKMVHAVLGIRLMVCPWPYPPAAIQGIYRPPCSFQAPVNSCRATKHAGGQVATPQPRPPSGPTSLVSMLFSTSTPKECGHGKSPLQPGTTNYSLLRREYTPCRRAQGSGHMGPTAKTRASGSATLI